jgi:pimeloyl-ACP methyl ester carboxylesterase
MKRWSFWRAFCLALLALALVVLVGPFLVPVPPADGTRPVSQLADPDSQFAEINGISVHYKTMGQNGPIFVLLHGFGASLFSWHAVMEPLSWHGTAIAYDRPAFGLTERPVEWSGESPYSLQSNVDLLLGFLDHFSVPKAILVGNSAGGTVAMQFYLQHPERVEALILVDPAVYGNNNGPAWLRLLYGTPQVQHLGPLMVRAIQKNGLDLIRTAWHDPSKIMQETWDGYTKPLHAENWDRALWYFTSASQPSNLASRMKEFRVPVLVITGDDDRIVPAAKSITLAGEIPGAQLVVIKDAGHVPHEEQPGAFMEAVDAFVSHLPISP